MLYAVELLPDEETQEGVRQIWWALEKAGLGGRLLQDGSLPHLTLALVRDAQEAALARQVGALAGQNDALSLKLVSLGIFPTSLCLYLSPLVNQDLLTLHERCHEALAPFDTRGFTYYTPGNWVPHCALALLEDRKDLPRAAAYLAEKAAVFPKARAVELAVAKIVCPVSLLGRWPLRP